MHELPNAFDDDYFNERQKEGGKKERRKEGKDSL